MAKKNLTTKEMSILKRMYLWSHTTFVNFNMTKMEANAFTMTMAPVIEEVYGDNIEGKKAAYVRHNAFFNTHTVPLAFIAGLCGAMEKDVADGKVPGQTVDAIKASLMGPTAGMFDSLFFNCLRVIIAGICIGLAETGNILGPILFFVLYAGSQEIVRWLLLKTGYTLGTSFIDAIFNSGLMTIATRSASILGLMMVGAMTATTVKFPMNWTITVGKASVEILPLFEAIYPGILCVGLTLLMMVLIKKGRKPIQLILGLFAFGMLGALVGIF